MRSRPWLGGCVGLLLGCGAPTPPKVVPPVAKPAPATLVSPARWSWPRTTEWVTDARRYDGVGLLLVGRHGRRALVVAGTKTMELAPSVVEAELVGSFRTADGKFAFVADDGAIHLAAGPLEPITVVRKGPEGAVGAPTLGRSTVQFTHEDGRMLRTTDAGLTWTLVDGARSLVPPHTRVRSAALSGTGHGLVVLWPQRVLATADDGLTWTRIDSAGAGADRIHVDADGRLYLEGTFDVPTPFARLDAARLVPFSTKPPSFEGDLTLELESPASKTDDDFQDHVRQRVHGDRVVVAHTVKEGGATRVELFVGALSGRLTRVPVGRPGDEADAVALAGMHALVVLRDEAGTRLIESQDGGLTFTEAKVPGTLGALRGVFATSDGAVWVTADCKDDDCSLFVRHKDAFERVASEPILPLDLVDDGARVYLLDARKDALRVHAGPLAGAKLEPTKLTAPSENEALAFTVDASSTVRLFRSGARALHRMGPDGVPLPVLTTGEELGNVDLSGLHGFATLGYETRDGGEHWWKVPTIEPFVNGKIDCGAKGCLVRTARRLGWDLPAGAPTVTLGATPPKAGPPVPDTPDPEADPPAPPAPPPAKAKAIPFTRCKADGPVAQGWPTIEGTDLAPDVDWALHDEDAKGAAVLRLGRPSGKVDTVVLLPAKTPSDKTIRTLSGVGQGAAWVARLHYVAKTKGTDEPYNPVDVEVGWWLAKDGKVRHSGQKAVPPFRIGRFDRPGSFLPFGDDFYFQPRRGLLYTLHADGKVDTTKVPHLDLDLVLAHRTPAGAVGLVGRSWAGLTVGEGAGDPRRWTLGASSVSVGLLGGKPYAGFDGLLLPLAAPAVDPPLEAIVETHSLGRCAAGPREGLFTFQTWSYLGKKKPKPVVIGGLPTPPLEVDGVALSGTETATRTTLDGSCTAAEVFTGGSRTILYSYVHPKRAWGMTQTKAGHEVRRYSCAP